MKRRRRGGREERGSEGGCCLRERFWVLSQASKKMQRTVASDDGAGHRCDADAARVWSASAGLHRANAVRTTEQRVRAALPAL